jgi:hypothetical protein
MLARKHPGDFDAWIAAPFYRIPYGTEPTVAHSECECRQGRSVNGETKNKVKTPRRLDFFSLLMQASRCVRSLASMESAMRAYLAGCLRPKLRLPSSKVAFANGTRWRFAKRDSLLFRRRGNHPQEQILYIHRFSIFYD